MSFDRLGYLCEEATQRAEQAYHSLDTEHGGFLERTHVEYVSRARFRTLAKRVKNSGAPFGAHTIVYRSSGELLLCRHEGAGLWVLPGGGLDSDESFREAAARELEEEAGLAVRDDGLAIATRIEIRSNSGDLSTWGVMPVFAAEAETFEPTVADPDGEISTAKWFLELPENTRDREDLLDWRERVL